MSVLTRMTRGRSLFVIVLCLPILPLVGCDSGSTASQTDTAAPSSAITKKSKKEQEAFDNLTPREKRAMKKAKGEG